MKSHLVLIVCFSFLVLPVYGQRGLKKTPTSCALSIGVVRIPRGNTQPYILSYFFQNTGPMITGFADYNKTSKSSHSFHARYGVLSSINHTIVIPALDTSDTEMIYDLKGIAQLFSLGYSWKRFFGSKTWMQAYTLTGGELLFQNRGTQTGYYYSSWLSGIVPYVNPGYSVFSLNVRLGLGIRHQLTDRLSLFEQAEAGTLLFHSTGNGFQFSPTKIPRELILNATLGIAFELK